MKEERRKEALSACEKFFIESKWNFHTGLVTDLWLAAVEWADDNLSVDCSTAGIVGVPFGGIRHAGAKIKMRNKKSSAASAD